MRPTRQLRQNLRDDEPLELRYLKKKEIYSRLREEWFLPSINSRGVNRAYVVGVFMGQHYRVRNVEIKHFEAELTEGQRKKAPVYYASQIVVKLNHLLEEQDLPQLGFENGVLPEEDWLLSIARYIDRRNLLGVFLQAIPGTPEAPGHSQRMQIAKANAENFLLLQQGLLTQTSLFKLIESLHEQGKRLNGHRQDLLLLVQKGRALENSINEEEVELRDKLSKAALSIFHIGNRENNPEQLFHEQNGVQQREQVAQIQDILEFIYVSDVVMDRRPQTLELCERFWNRNAQQPPPNDRRPEQHQGERGRRPINPRDDDEIFEG